MNTYIGLNILRKESWDKVTGKAEYTADFITPDMLYAKLVTSKTASGIIKSINKNDAEKMPGVKAVITGMEYPVLTGILIQDRPVLAVQKVRYYGEPVALVVALSEHEAENAARMVKVEYETLPVIDSPIYAMQPDAPLIHEAISSYTKLEDDVYPISKTNISSVYTIQKGDNIKGWAESEFTAEQSFILKKSYHAAIEPRVAIAKIMSDGNVHIATSTQSPYAVKELVSKFFNIEEGKVNVVTPFVGGAFGGKSAIYLEFLAYIASKAVCGRPVCLSCTREQDMETAPGRLGLEAKIKLGASKDGIIKAADMSFYLDGGAYADINPYMSRSIACDCSGPYNIENLICNSYCVYTNHPYSTSFRGFGHESYTFCIERMMDILAVKCGIDPLEFRSRNAIKAGHYSPTQIEITKSNTGNLSECISKLKTLIKWDEGSKIILADNRIIAKGMSCLWKAPNPPTNASSGAIITFNSDGSVNLSIGVVEIGSGSQTLLAQILAEKLKMNPDRIYVKPDINTQQNPKHWKTVASISSYLAGRAVLNAADDVINQLKNIASVALRSPMEDLEIADEKVYLKHNPKYAIGFQDLVHGLKYPDGNTVGSQIIGRGSFILNHLSPINEQTGKGKPSNAWTVGAQAVEIEYNPIDYTYKILKAATVIDIGKLINPNTAECIIRGGMSMGISLATREEFLFDNNCIMQNSSLRNYKLLHIGQEPDYLIDFVITPQEDAPYGTRSYAEHGIIGIPAAIANALSLASGARLNELPLSPEYIWKSCTGGSL